MPSLPHLLQYALNAVLFLLFASVLLAVYKQIVKSVPKATGDEALAKLVDDKRNRWTTHKLAVAVVDLKASTTVRQAFITCDAEHRFELGTLTQGLTGLLVADAVTRRGLPFTMPMANTFPELGDKIGAETLQSLVTHTSGLPRLPLSSVPRSYATQLFGISPLPKRGPDMVKLAAKQPLRRRGRFTPSLLGAALAGELVAAHADMSFPEVMQQRIFQPVGMTNTTVSVEDHKGRRGWTSIGRRALLWKVDGYAPAVGAMSNLTDMTTLATRILTGKAPGRKALEAIDGVETGIIDRSSGMFWQVEQLAQTRRRMVWLDGMTTGYSSFVALMPENKRAVIVLSDCNAGPITRKLAMDVASWAANNSN